jgi:hypothetical protein
MSLDLCKGKIWARYAKYAKGSAREGCGVCMCVHKEVGDVKNELVCIKDYVKWIRKQNLATSH